MKNHFEHIIGQESIKARLAVSVQAPEGISLAQPFMAGPAGLGKTEISKPYAEAIMEKLAMQSEENGDPAPKMLWFNSPGEFRHTESQEFEQIVEWCEHGCGVLAIDEFHDFGTKTTKSMQTVLSFLLRALDEQNRGKEVQFDLRYDLESQQHVSRSFTYNKAKQVVIGMSNHDNRVNPALLSRMDICRLSPYTVEQLELITVKMAADNELAIEEEKTAKLLAMASRGTARPLNNMIRHIKKYGADTITREIAIRAMVELEMFPHGLTADEVRLLQLAKKGVQKQVARQALPSITAINDQIAYMMSRQLIASDGKMLKTTTKGNSYVTNLAKNGFIAA